MQNSWIYIIKQIHFANRLKNKRNINSVFLPPRTFPDLLGISSIHLPVPDFSISTDQHFTALTWSFVYFLFQMPLINRLTRWQWDPIQQWDLLGNPGLTLSKIFPFSLSIPLSFSVFPSSDKDSATWNICQMQRANWRDPRHLIGIQ